MTDWDKSEVHELLRLRAWARSRSSSCTSDLSQSVICFSFHFSSFRFQLTGNLPLKTGCERRAGRVPSRTKSCNSPIVQPMNFCSPSDIESRSIVFPSAFNFDNATQALTSAAADGLAPLQ